MYISYSSLDYKDDELNDFIYSLYFYYLDFTLILCLDLFLSGDPGLFNIFFYTTELVTELDYF